jgi:uncharacterized protein (TIGR03437 family)
MKHLIQVAIIVALGSSLNGQTGHTFDATGNGLLHGAFNFRHLTVTNLDANNNPTEITASFGVITFDGHGNYSLTGSSIDNTIQGGAPQALHVASGKYTIGSSGSGYLTNPLAPGDASNVIRGAVAQGVFVGSDTENRGIACPADSTTTCLDFDVFIAIPVGTLAGNASLNGSYQVGLLDFTAANTSAIRNALFTLPFDGNGGLGIVDPTTLLQLITIQGQSSEQPGTPPTQLINKATYAVNGDSSVTLTLPTPAGGILAANALFTGTRTMFVSADGNFVLGWTPTGFDIFVGVKPLAQSAVQANTRGLFFVGGLEDSPAGAGVDSFYGAINGSGDDKGDVIVHQRVHAPLLLPYDYVSDDVIFLNDSGNAGSDFNGYQYSFGANGLAFVGTGTAGNFALIFGVQAPAFSGPGVFLHPLGVVNAASYAPATAALAPGELILLYGSGLAAGTHIAPTGQAFPNTLGGVQVTINGIRCALYYVSPTLIAATVPYSLSATPTFLADVQVNNNAALSNIVQLYWQPSAPAVFSLGEDGIGQVVALHAANGSLVTAAHPALAGESIQLFMTGLGTVTPAVADGAIGPAAKPSVADGLTAGSLLVTFNDYTKGTATSATITSAGLTVGLAGLYEVTVQVPAGLSAGGVVYIEIRSEGADVNEILVPIG